MTKGEYLKLKCIRSTIRPDVLAEELDEDFKNFFDEKQPKEEYELECAKRFSKDIHSFNYIQELPKGSGT